MRVGSLINTASEMTAKLTVFSKKKVAKKCLEAGNELINVAKENNGKLTIEQVNAAYKRVIPKGSKLNATNDFKAAKAFLKEMDFDDDYISDLAETASAFVTKNCFGDVLFYLPIEKFSDEMAVNYSVHEFEHALDKTFTISGKTEVSIFSRISNLGRCLDRNNLDSDTYAIKYDALESDIFSNILGDNPDRAIPKVANKQGFMGYTRIKSIQELKDVFSNSIKKILFQDSEILNIRICKSIKADMADEAVAYKIGGQMENKYLNREEASVSELVSILYSEASKAAGAEITTQRFRLIKKFFGLGAN